MNDILTPEEAARYLRVSRPTLLKAVKQQDFPVMYVGARWRVSKAVLDKYLAGEQSKPRRK